MRPFRGAILFSFLVGLLGEYYAGAGARSLVWLIAVAFFGGLAAGAIREPESEDYVVTQLRFLRSFISLAVPLLAVLGTRILSHEVELSEQSVRLIEVHLATIGLSAFTIGGYVFREHKAMVTER